MSNEYLEHHGIKGQKWGIRRYQNADGSLTALGRKRRGLSDAKPESGLKKAMADAKEKSAERKAEYAVQRHENLKQYVRNHPKAIYRNRTEFSADEINKLVEDIKADRRLKDIRDEEIRRGWEKVKTFSDNLGKVKNLAENAKGVYNLAAEVNNALVDSGTFKNGTRLLKIGERPETPKDTSWEDRLKTGDYNEILKDRSQLTNSQLKDVWNRMTTEQAIDKIAGDTSYKGKHLKHALEVSVKDIQE